MVAAIEPVLDNNSAYPAVADLQWADSRTIVFRARASTPVFQAVKVDVVTRRLTQMTRSPTDVVSFAVAADLRRVVYTAQQANPPLAPGGRSIVVGNESFRAVTAGQDDMRVQLRRYRHFVTEAGSKASPRPLGEVFSDGGTLRPPVGISPDGRSVLLPRYDRVRQLAWSRQYPLVARRLNAGFDAAWGTVRRYGWKDAKGREWNGGLLVPAGHDAGTRYRLVIQTHGFQPDRFYLDGANSSISFTSGFADRAFLREGMLVLAFPVRPDTDLPRTESGDIAGFMDGVRGAIEALIADGLVDRDRVGIMGWSMTGERVLKQVTFSDVPIRAATTLDGDANTLFALTVTYGASDGIQARKATTNDGLLFGETLATWVRNDPALHTDCVRAALHIESYGPWVRNNWDVYGLLRCQFKPTEMVIFPGGTHGLMTPCDRMISLQGNVDWFRSWLKGEERSEPLLRGESDLALKDQYQRWQEMARLKHADDARPVCARKGGQVRE